MKQFLWLPLVMLEYFLVGYLTVKNNQGAGWGLLLWVAGALPIWTLISKYSNDLVFDGLLFDVTMVLTYTLTVVSLTGSWSKLSTMQFIGMALVFFGLYFIRKDF